MLKFEILAFILVNIVLVQSTSYEDTAFCLRGPSNWCKDLSSANRCGAFKHCLQTVWTKHERYLTIAKGDTTCDSCVKCLRGNYQSCPALEANLDDISNMFLANLPLETICKLANSCDKPVEPFEVVQAPSLISEQCGLLHPRQWCDSIDNARKCNAMEKCRTEWKSLRPMVLNKEYEKSDATCGFCIWTFNNLHEILQKNLTEFSIQEYLEGACTLIQDKTQQKQCMGIIEKNLPEIYNFIRDSMDPGIICRVIKFCNDQHLSEKQDKKKTSLFDYIKIEVVNPESVIIKTPYNSKIQTERIKTPLLGDKTEVLVSKLIKTNGVACEVCSIVLTAAKYMIENDKEEDKILHFISKELCGRMGSLNGTCSEYVNTFGKEILNELINGVDPSIVCNKMGLCLKSQITSDNTKRFFDINVKDSLNCTLCKTVMTEVKTMLDNKQNENQILDYIRKNLCEKTGQYSEMCKTVINAYGPIILQLLANDINPQQVCVIIGMCQKQPSKIENTPKCAICEFVLSTLTNFISQNSSASEVEKWLDYVCGTVMPVTIRDECKAFVNDYGPVVISLLVNEIQPTKICQFIGLCNKTTEIAKKVTMPVEAKVEASPQCVICEFVLTVLSSYISQNSTGPEVEKWLEYVCKTVMPETIRSECVAFVDQYEPVIIQLLVNGINPDKVCQTIHVCDKHSITNTQTETAVQQQPQSSANPVYCTACQYVIQFLKYELEKNNSKEAIEHALNTVCKLAPKSTKAQCESIVSTYGPYLIDLIEKYGDPLVVCQQIKLCGQSNAEEQQVIAGPQQQQRSIVDDKLPQATFECTACLYIAEILDNALKQNKTDTEIAQELEKVCNVFPSPIKDQCKSFLDEYADYVLQLLAEDLDPNQVCQKLKLCKQFSSFADIRSIIRSNRNKLTKN